MIVDSDTLRLTKEDSVRTVQLQRSRSDKEITVIRDTSINSVVLQPQVSGTYWFNFFSAPAYGIGFLIDIGTAKKWQYPPDVYLSDDYIKANSPEVVDAERAEEINRHSRKGVMNLRLSLPWFNFFNYSYEGQGTREGVGFLGMSLGLDYYYSDKAFVNVSGVGIMDYFPFPFLIDHMSSVYGYVSNNHKIMKMFAVGYGISAGYDTWNTKNNDFWKPLINVKSVYRDSGSLGLVFPVHYYVGNGGFYMGVVYRPMLLQFSSITRFRYQDTVSLEVGWRIRLKQPSN